jgi:hypothetical protein
VQAHAADPLAGLADDAPVLQLAADGKTVRGARDADGRQLHLLGVYQVGPGVMLAQREMRHKPHETVHFAAALDLIADITGAIVTADALHTVAGHPRYLHRRGAYGLFPVKENRAALFAQLNALDWDESSNKALVPVERTVEANSGRHETRVVRVQPLAPGQVNFPHAAQALLVERYTTGRGDGKTHAVAELGVTTAPAEAADTATLARCVRGQWPSRPSTSSGTSPSGRTPPEPAPAACPAPWPPSAASRSASTTSPDGPTTPPPTTTTATTPPMPYANSVSQGEHASRLGSTLRVLVSLPPLQGVRRRWSVALST